MQIRHALRCQFLWSAFCLFLFSISQAAAVTPTVAKQFAPSSIPAGGVSTLTITLGDNPPVTYSLTAAFIDTFPTNLFVANTPNLGGTGPGTVTANAGSGSLTMATGSSIPLGGCTVTVNVTVNVPG